MVVRRRKKLRKMRGLRWHGWGAKKKRRGSGSRGGKGNAGPFAHRRTYLLRFDPDHIGKRGFIRPGSKKRGSALNVRDLEEIAKQTGKKELDLQELGCDKLLGAGKISLSLKVKGSVTETARKKIEAAGGSVAE